MRRKSKAKYPVHKTCLIDMEKAECGASLKNDGTTPRHISWKFVTCRKCLHRRLVP